MMVYDDTSGEWLITTPAGRIVRRTIDQLGNTGDLFQAALVDGTGTPLDTVTDYLYDGFGRPTSITQGARGTTMTYDPTEGWLKDVVRNVVAGSPAQTETTTYTRDGAWRITDIQRPDLQHIGQTWDDNGNLLTLTPPGKPAHTFGYTDLDQRSSYAPPDTSGGSNEFVTTWLFDGDRRTEQVGYPSFNPLDYAYDPATGKLSAITQGGTSLRGYGYDAVTGQLTSVATPFGGDTLTLSYGHDGHLPTSFDWALQTAGPLGSVSLDHDDNFWVNEETVTAGTTVSAIAYVHDDDGLPTDVGPTASMLLSGGVPSDCAPAAADCLSLTWEADTGRLSATSIGVIADSYGYSAYGDLAAYTASANGEPVYGYTIDSRDLLGRIVQKTETVLGESSIYLYAYDAAGRLASVTIDGVLTREYSYDANGNRLSYAAGAPTPIATYDGQDRILTYETTTFSHNDRGDVTGTVDSATGQIWAFAWDAFGALVSATLDPGAGERVYSYRTDGQSRRVQRLIDGTATSTWLWRDQLRLAAELDNAGNLKARYVSALERNVPEVILEGGVVKRLITDHLGSVRLVLDASSGEVLETYRYDEFGQVLEAPLSPEQPFGFAGGLYDPATGLVRFGAREYDPARGRWLSRDPIHERGGLANMHSYVGGDPVNVADASGLFLRVA